MNSTPEQEKDNWWKFGDPLDSFTDDNLDAIEFDPEADLTEEDDYSEQDQE